MGRSSKELDLEIQRLKDEISKLNSENNVLANNLHKHQSLLSEIGEGVYTADENGRLTYVNQIICEMFGYENPSQPNCLAVPEPACHLPI